MPLLAGVVAGDCGPRRPAGAAWASYGVARRGVRSSRRTDTLIRCWVVGHGERHRRLDRSRHHGRASVIGFAHAHFFALLNVHGRDEKTTNRRMSTTGYRSPHHHMRRRGSSSVRAAPS